MSERPSNEALTTRLRADLPPKTGWVLEAKSATEPSRVGVHLLDGSFRYGIWVAIKEGGAGKDPWELMYQAVKALYGQLLEDNLSTDHLPRGDEGESVTFADGVVMKVVVENQWSGNPVSPDYPL
ncbi:MAG TPA: hypothetical protein VFS67_33980 [Polyangiaceae bacterium]|jgi:hypothetical protein|nr:hypothetical protein [Polyangiaceae bacterium]